MFAKTHLMRSLRPQVLQIADLCLLKPARDENHKSHRLAPIISPTSAAALLTEANSLNLSTNAHSVHAPLPYATIVITLAPTAHHHKSKDFSISTSTKVPRLPVLSRMTHITGFTPLPQPVCIVSPTWYGSGHFCLLSLFQVYFIHLFKGYNRSTIHPIIHLSTLSLAVNTNHTSAMSSTRMTNMTAQEPHPTTQGTPSPADQVGDKPVSLSLLF